jgi:D-alanyl-D-alanine carboxypeptidase/D-alanyl-D-alanine-endopeptidase (penicillin-binding protein 4)
MIGPATVSIAPRRDCPPRTPRRRCAAAHRWAACLVLVALTGALPAGRLARASNVQAAPAVDSAAPAAPATEGARFSRLRKQLEGLLNSGLLRNLRVGLTVRDADSGEEVLSHNASAPFNPASNTKIFTTAAALSVLGPEFRYQTVLLAKAPPPAEDFKEALVAALVPPATEEVIAGDVFLQGSGDPSLTPAGLAELARDLAASGVRRIEGDVVLDGQFRDLQALQQSAAAASYGAGAIILNRNAYAVRIEASSVGQAANVWVDPRSSFFVVHNLVRTVRGKKSRITVDQALQGERLAVTVRGRIGAQRSRVSVRQHISFANTWAAAILGQALADSGITVRGTVRVGPPPKGPLRVLATHRSDPLSDICRVVNKDSNNYVADIIWKTLGAERFGLPGTLEKGAQAVGEWLEPFGLSPTRVHLVNGSGLTYENRVRPEDLGQLLYRLYHSLDLGPVFMQTLAVGGIDGTIHYRFRGPLSGLVRGKTGTLNGVSVLSGYVGAQPGVLIFTIFVEGFRPRRLEAIRHAQTELVEQMMRSLREGGGPAALPTLPATPSLPATPEAAPGSVPEPGSPHLDPEGDDAEGG